MAVIDLLRERTALLHDRVERVVDLKMCCESPVGYRALLMQLLGLYRPLEHRLSSFEWSAAGIGLEERRKTKLLSADLEALGLTPAQVACVLDCAAIPTPASLAEAVGCLYVLEGATLGGKVIARQVRQSLGITPATGGSFHAAYGQSGGLMWRAFCESANCYCRDDPERNEQAVIGAVATFEAFSQCLATKAADEQRLTISGAGRR